MSKKKSANAIYTDMMLAAVNLGIGLGILARYAAEYWAVVDLREKFPPGKPLTVAQLRENLAQMERSAALTEMANERVKAKKAMHPTGTYPPYETTRIDPEGQSL
jgi:hypothetical protein